MGNTIDINLYAFGNGSSNFDCEKGPDVLKKAIEKTELAKQCHWLPTLSVSHHKQQAEAKPDILKLSEKLANLTRQSTLNNHFFVTLGGDHTAAIGSWSGAANAVENLGLIWFDAHMDSHTPETSPSQNIHGMPLATLLGHGESDFVKIMTEHPKLKPENVVLIGVRSYESGEAALLKKLGVSIFYMDDIKKFGMHKVIQESIAIATRNTDAFGISIDLDGFDPEDAPGVGTPAPDGVNADAFLAEFSQITEHPLLIGADIVEFNPALDRDHKTEKLAVNLFRQLVLHHTTG
ncbi:MAG: hypothetical protein A3F13_05550 [Gammaproteobacteria bacterium RIFCSPHIGHO2_12_FULL_40_19]|nr:MAG: hypothetical protein A3F13_05550 [Gammaproteobacteria bacterium RIFCSPHIGHO2_12_FULL_40_19]